MQLMMKKDSKLIIAAAGSGKTTFLVNEALQNKNSNILITTYTQANDAGIHNKFIKLNGYIPKNVTIQTWFNPSLQRNPLSSAPDLPYLLIKSAKASSTDTVSLSSLVSSETLYLLITRKGTE